MCQCPLLDDAASTVHYSMLQYCRSRPRCGSLEPSGIRRAEQVARALDIEKKPKLIHQRSRRSEPAPIAPIKVDLPLARSPTTCSRFSPAPPLFMVSATEGDHATVMPFLTPGRSETRRLLRAVPSAHVASSKSVRAY
ncbi:hypothetical protein BJV77DRAFT_165780 [Russula vinacea]|nr:hypothetical protein BJV77DRAFT_165780 [Russula vinacea]